MTIPQPKKVLVVEDEPLVAMLLEDLLSEMGYEVVGPVGRLNDALALAEQADLDFALLDVNLGGQQSFPVADILRERGVPFLFATGYGGEGFQNEYSHHPTLRKPYESRDLDKAIQRSLEAGAGGSHGG